jgi:polyisoprenoid-binding protein YceI
MRNSSCLSLIAFVLGITVSVEAETYSVDVTHSSVDFTIRHLVSRTKGRFGDFTGSIDYDPTNPTVRVSGTIQVGSIDTGNERRDRHLQNADFFDAAKFPTITFESTGTAIDEGVLNVTGNLTMHGVTREATLPVVVLGTGTNPRSGKAQAGFEARVTILCSEYGVNSWERFSAILGDEVEIHVLIEANADD